MTFVGLFLLSDKSLQKHLNSFSPAHWRLVWLAAAVHGGKHWLHSDTSFETHFQVPYIDEIIKHTVYLFIEMLQCPEILYIKYPQSCFWFDFKEYIKTWFFVIFFPLPYCEQTALLSLRIAPRKEECKNIIKKKKTILNQMFPWASRTPLQDFNWLIWGSWFPDD